MTPISPTDGDDHNSVQARLHRAITSAGLPLEELWMRYFALGGDAGLVEVEAYLNGLMRLSSLQHDMLAQAINERLNELGPPRAPYSFEWEDDSCSDHDG